MNVKENPRKDAQDHFIRRFGEGGAFDHKSLTKTFSSVFPFPFFFSLQETLLQYDSVVHILDNTDKNRANIENKKYKEEALEKKEFKKEKSFERDGRAGIRTVGKQVVVTSCEYVCKWKQVSLSRTRKKAVPNKPKS